MKAQNSARLGLVCLLFTFCLTGCDTTGNGGASGDMKTRGVYTTLAPTKPELDMPGYAYVPKSSFAVGESPAAVIVGFGNYNQPELVSLLLIESGSGRIMLQKNYFANYGRAIVQRLPVRLSGDYELQLGLNNALADTWKFTVTRTNGAVAMPVPGMVSAAKYAEGVMSVSIKAEDIRRGFEDYDGRLIHEISAAEKDAVSTNADAFAQFFPGNVVIQFHLDSQGRVTDPKILENALDDECGQILVNALMEYSPYGAWPDDAHQSLGADSRDITIVIRLE